MNLFRIARALVNAGHVSEGSRQLNLNVFDDTKHLRTLLRSGKAISVYPSRSCSIPDANQGLNGRAGLR